MDSIDSLFTQQSRGSRKKNNSGRDCTQLELFSVVSVRPQHLFKCSVGKRTSRLIPVALSLLASHYSLVGFNSTPEPAVPAIPASSECIIQMETPTGSFTNSIVTLAPLQCWKYHIITTTGKSLNHHHVALSQNLGLLPAFNQKKKETSCVCLESVYWSSSGD